MCVSTEASQWWVETSSADFNDGYLYRSTYNATFTDLQIADMAEWLDTNWARRIVVRIDNSSSYADLTDYQITITTDTYNLIRSSYTRSDLGDIRVTDSDGMTLLPYWIVPATKNTTSTIIWTKVPLISHQSVKDIYIYISNPSTTTAENRDGVFDLYEDWESGSIDITKWSIGGNRPFRIASTGIPEDRIYEGNYAVCNSTLANSENSTLTIAKTISMEGKITFYWAAYCQGSGTDHLYFYLDGVQQKRIPTFGNQLHNYAQEEYQISSGEHSFKWEFSKDISITYPPDRGWVDLIIIRKYKSNDPPITCGILEEKKPYYTRGEYWSNVLDTQGDNTIIEYTSWTLTGLSTNVKAYFRTSNSSFSVISELPTYIEVTNFSNPTQISNGRYLQYKIVLLGDGVNTPYFEEMSIKYNSPPLKPSKFHGVAVSTYTIDWSWLDNSPSETGYRVYSASKTFSSSGYLLAADTAGVISELGVNTTFWVETPLKANTSYGRYSVAYNSVGGNASANNNGQIAPVYKYTSAVNANVAREKFFEDQPMGYHYQSYSTGSWTNDSEFYFTSNVSSGTDGVQYYRYDWSTGTTHSWVDTESLWTVKSSSKQHDITGDWIFKKPEILLPPPLNSDNWYFHVRSYNGDNESAGAQTLGPYYFNGCPSGITDLYAEPSKLKEGEIVLTWTAPYADATFNNISNGKFLVRHSNFLINTDAKFDAAYVINKDTTVTQGVGQRILVTSLVPGTTYWFNVKAQDSTANKGELSNIFVGCPAAKVAKLVFISPAQTIYVGFRSEPFIIQCQDKDGNPLQIEQEINIYFQSTSGKGEFSTTGEDGSYGAPYFTIRKGEYEGRFYYRDLNSGAPTITVSETSSRGWSSGSQGITIIPGAATTFSITHDAKGTIWTPESMVIKAVDNYGNISAQYRGKVSIISSDPSNVVVIPSSYTIGAGDNGQFSAQINNFTVAKQITYTAEELTDETYNKLYFDGLETGWLVGTKGTIKKTANAGADWFSQIYGTAAVNGLESIYFVNSSTGWAVGSNGSAYKTTDGGLSWNPKSTGVLSTMHSVHFADINTGWAVGNGVILKSMDSGNTWVLQLSTSLVLNAIHMFSATDGIALGDGGAVVKTFNGGTAWSQVTVPTVNNLQYAVFLDTSTGWAVGTNGTIVRTLDSGTSWVVQNSTTTENVFGMAYIDSNNLWAVGDNSTLLRTINGGTTWTKVNYSFGANLKSIFFVSQNIGWIAGANGTIYKTTDGGTSWVKYYMRGTSAVMNWNGLVCTPRDDIFTAPPEVVQSREGQAVGMFGLSTREEGTSSAITKLTITRTGTGSDSDISVVRLFKDQGNLRFDPPSDGQKASGVFSSGTVTFNLIETITNTTNYYFVAFDVLDLAVLDKTLGFSINYDGITVSSGILPARNNLPYNSATPYIAPSSCTVRVIVNNLTSNTTAYQGYRDILMWTLDMNTDRARSPFTALKLRQNGKVIPPRNAENGEIIRVYADTDPDGKLNTIYDTMIGSGVFSTSDLETIVHLSTQTITQVQSFFFVTVSFPAEYNCDKFGNATFKMLLQVSTAYLFLSPEGNNGILPMGSAYDSTNGWFLSQEVVVYPEYDLVTLIPDPPAGGRAIYQGATEKFMSFAVEVDSNVAYFEGIGVNLGGDDLYTARQSSTDANYVFIYIDSGTLPGVLLSSASFNQGLAWLEFSDTSKVQRLEAGTRKRYNLYVLLDKLASVGNTIQLRIENSARIVVRQPDEVSSANLPAGSPVHVIADYPDIVRITAENLPFNRDRLYSDNSALAWVYENEGALVGDITVGKLNMSAYSSAKVSALTFTHKHREVANVKGSDIIDAVKVYADTDNNGLFNTDDVLLSTGAFTYSDIEKTQATVTLSPVQVVQYNSTHTYFVVYDVARSTPSIGKILNFDDRDYVALTVVNPDLGSVLAPFKAVALYIKDPKEPTCKNPGSENALPVIKNIGTVYYTNQPSMLKFAWELLLPEAGTVTYNYAVGTSTGDTAVQQWTLTIDRSAFITGVNLLHDSTYYFRLKAMNAINGQSYTSSEAWFVFHVDLTAPVMPSAAPYIPSGTGGTSFWLNWYPAVDYESNVSTYTLERQVNTSPLWETVSESISGSLTAYHIDNLTNGYFYRFRVKSRNGAGTVSSYSLSSAWYTPLSPGEVIKEISSYPNPVDIRDTNVTITYILNADMQAVLKIYDVFGELVKTFSFNLGENGGANGPNSVTWDGRNELGNKVSTGMYFLYIDVKTPAGSTEHKTWKIGIMH